MIVMSGSFAIPGLLQALAVERLMGGRACESDLGILHQVFRAEGLPFPTNKEFEDARFLVLNACRHIPEDQARLLFPSVPADANLLVSNHGAAEGFFLAVRFDPAAIASKAAPLLAKGLVEQACRGLVPPEEVISRVKVATSRSLISRNLYLSAADHLAEHVCVMCEEIPGARRISDGSVFWVCHAEMFNSSALDWLSSEGPGRFATFVAALVPGRWP